MCSTNCTVIPVAMTLVPLHRSHGIRSVRVRTEQPLSGGGANLLQRGLSGADFERIIPGEGPRRWKKNYDVYLQILQDDGTERHAMFDVNIQCSRGKTVIWPCSAYRNSNQGKYRCGNHTSSWATQSSILHLSLPSSPTFPLIVRETYPTRSRFPSWRGYIR